MTSLVFPACFLALAALSGLAAANGRRWALRLPLLAATPVLALAVWWQLSQRDGLPTGARPADGSALVASVVQAPTPGDAGAIYLWARPPNSETPRSYRLPYTPATRASSHTRSERRETRQAHWRQDSEEGEGLEREEARRGHLLRASVRPATAARPGGEGSLRVKGTGAPARHASERLASLPVTVTVDSPRGIGLRFLRSRARSGRPFLQ